MVPGGAVGDVDHDGLEIDVQLPVEGTLDGRPIERGERDPGDGEHDYRDRDGCKKQPPGERASAHRPED